jgi:hypothetical protein
MIAINRLCIILVLSSISFASYAQSSKRADKEMEKWRYEIEVMGIGVEGTSLVKVWTYAKKADVAIEHSKKNAIHGIIFRGYAGKSGVPAARPLAQDQSLETTRADYFDIFFNDGGKYLKYVSLSNDGNVAIPDILKVGKEFKIGVVVSVRISELRKELESAGVIKSLNTGF